MYARVLLAVLDWGLGHATRCVPVVHALSEKGAEVVLAGSGRSLDYLKGRFPEVEAFEIPDREVRYNPRGAAAAIWRRAFAQPILNDRQRKFLSEEARYRRVTHIISDNVYGAYSPVLPSVLITHQLGPKAPAMQGMAHRILARWMNRFDAVWIPDEEGDDSLSGDLAFNRHYEGEVEWIGRLSRFGRGREALCNISATALLSGPEPQRSIFEERVVEVFRDIPGRKVVIRGRTDLPKPDWGEDIECMDFADGVDLRNVLRRSSVVLSRSGFSTLCDLMALGCRACVVPTPGQSEQEYLADRVRAKKWFASTAQNTLTADTVLSASKLAMPPKGKSRLDEVLDAFLDSGKS